MEPCYIYCKKKEKIISYIKEHFPDIPDLDFNDNDINYYMIFNNNIKPISTIYNSDIINFIKTYYSNSIIYL